MTVTELPTSVSGSGVVVALTVTSGTSIALDAGLASCACGAAACASGNTVSCAPSGLAARQTTGGASSSNGTRRMKKRAAKREPRLAAAKSEIGTENLAVNVDRHCELNFACDALRTGMQASFPRCTPPGDFTRDHGLAAGLLARRSVLAAAFPRAKLQVALWPKTRCLQLRGQPWRCASPRAPRSLLIPCGNHQGCKMKLRPSSVKQRTRHRRKTLVPVTFRC